MRATTLFLEPATGLGRSRGANGIPVRFQGRVRASSTDLFVRGDSDRRGNDSQREWAQQNLRAAAATPLQINRAYYDEYADHFQWRTAALPMNAA